MTDTFKITVPLNIEIDEEGNIIGIYLRGTLCELVPDDDALEYLKITNEDAISEILEENEKEAADWERHIKQESRWNKYL